MKNQAAFEALWTDFLEGELDVEGMNRLRELLASDPGLQSVAVSLYQNHRLLGLAHESSECAVDRFVANTLDALPASEDLFNDKVMASLPGMADEKAGSGANRKWLAIAACLMVGLAGTLMFALFGQGRTFTDEESDPLATLLLTDHCEWIGETPIEGGRLARGPLRLAAGTAVIRFAGGAELMLKGESELVLESAGSARLVQGEAIVHAPEQAAGFTIHTEASDIVDLGTEFAVRVESAGATEVHVLDGLVEYRAPQVARDLATPLLAGKAIRVESSDSAARSVTLNDSRYDQLLTEARSRAAPDRLRVYEGFDYHLGMLRAETMTGGFGWAGAWRLRLPAERKITESESDDSLLSDLWPGGDLLGFERSEAAVQFPRGFTVRTRGLAEGIDMARDGVVYISLLVQEPRLVDRRRMPPDTAARLTLRAKDDYWGDSISFGLNRSLRPQIQTGQGIGFRSVQPLEAGQTMLWVAKITSNESGFDEVLFHIFDADQALPMVEPGDWQVVARGVRSEALLDLLLITSQGPAPRFVDELKIGATWRAVVPVQRVLAKR